jgi:hypothetical protein
LIKELIARGDLQCCLIVCPGSLAEQWQDERFRHFHLPLEILTNDKLESARTGNWFLEHHLVIARLDKLARDDSVQEKLRSLDRSFRAPARNPGPGVAQVRPFLTNPLASRPFVPLTSDLTPIRLLT